VGRRFSFYSLVVYVGVLVYVIVMSYYTLLKYYTFHTHAADLGIFVQALASTLYYHRLFYESVDVALIPRPGPIGYSFLDIHFSPTLFLFLPIYAVYPSPVTLLVVQSVFVALGALPIYWLGRYLGREGLGAFFALIYLLDPLVQGANSFDFHMETIFMPLALFAIYALIRGRWRLYYPMLLLALGTIEFAPIPMALLGVYQLVRGWRRRVDVLHGVVTILVSVGVLVLALWLKSVFNPLGPTTSSSLSGLPAVYSSYSGFGVVFAVLRDPSLLVGLYSVNGTQKFLYFLELYAPTAFTSFLDPLVLPSLAWPLAAFLTNNTIYYSPFFQYGSFSIPFIIAASLMALARLSRDGVGRFVVLVFVSSFIVFLGVSPLVHFHYVFTSVDAEVWRGLSLVPGNATVLVQNNLFPPFANDVNAYTQWYPWLKPEYIVAQPSSPWFTWWGTPYDAYVNLALSRGYGVYAVLGYDLLILKANYSGPPVLCRSVRVVLGPGNVSVVNGVFGVDGVMHTPSEPSGEWFVGGVYLLPGVYNVTITYGWVGPEYIKSLNVSLASVDFDGRSVDLRVGSNEVSFTVRVDGYVEVPIVAYANYVVNSTYFVRSIVIVGPLCGG
jgi:uncharacterized membrane protein